MSNEKTLVYQPVSGKEPLFEDLSSRAKKKFMSELKAARKKLRGEFLDPDPEPDAAAEEDDTDQSDNGDCPMDIDSLVKKIDQQIAILEAQSGTDDEDS